MFDFNFGMLGTIWILLDNVEYFQNFPIFSNVLDLFDMFVNRGTFSFLTTVP